MQVQSTHLNAYKRDLEEARQEVNSAQGKVDQLLSYIRSVEPEFEAEPEVLAEDSEKKAEEPVKKEKKGNG